MDTEMMKQRVASLLPGGVELMGLFPIECLALWKEKEPVAPRDMRPEVFSDLRMSGSFPYKVWSAGIQTFWSESLSGSPEMCADEQQRAEWKRKGKPY
ncbi:hypothetical protein [Streptomyces enissocaesilis]|uniref:Uncharacterized protein n=1 Tax=Streptomyces enissocaesilis TaxID=332589 RepID=A0ABP6K3U2_9ACTN